MPNDARERQCQYQAFHGASSKVQLALIPLENLGIRNFHGFSRESAIAAGVDFEVLLPAGVQKACLVLNFLF
jgi:hypothetical protein